MCIKCEILKTVAEALGAEIVEEKVGTASQELVAELTKLEEAEKKLQKDIDNALEEAAEAVKEVFKDKVEGLKSLKNDTWKEALASAGIDVEKQAADYSIDKNTCIVTRTKVVSKQQEPQEVH